MYALHSYFSALHVQYLRMDVHPVPIQRRLTHALASVVVVTGSLLVLRHFLAPINLLLCYVPLVLVVAIRAGRRAAVLAAVASFLAYNFFFVPPLYTLTVEQPQDVIELAVFLGVALLVGTLAARERHLAYMATQRAEQMTALYHLSQEISAAVDIAGMLPTITTAARTALVADGVVIRVHDAAGQLPHVAQAGHTVGDATSVVPIVLSGQQVGNLCVWSTASSRADDGVPLVQTVATQVALLVARAQAVEATLQTRSFREADRLKGALLSSVSHDLRTPLAAIKGAASNLLDTSVTWDAATQRLFAETISSEADRLNRFVRNLLEMSRLEGTHAPRPHTPVEIGDVIAQTMQRLRPVLDGHIVEFAIAPDLPAVPMDAVQIELVLSNLLENAARFAPHTPITVEAVCQDQALVVRVADRGPGVPPAVRDRIWDKFYRVAGPEHGPGGSGLGLAIAHSIVETHGGRICVDDRPGGGAIFQFTLPLAPASVPMSVPSGTGQAA